MITSTCYYGSENYKMYPLITYTSYISEITCISYTPMVPTDHDMYTFFKDFSRTFEVNFQGLFKDFSLFFQTSFREKMINNGLFK